MSQKSYDGSPNVYLIPTPIGNMEDITLRAINLLKEVEVVFCEDTRVTGLLLQHLDIKKRLIANHEFNEEENKNKLLSYLKEGFSVGIVTDRGTPIISDPGYELARYAIEIGYNVVGLPGATALIPALIMSGLQPSPFLFYGFLNSKQQRRNKELEELREIKATMIFYESPHRIQKTLNDMLEVLGNRKISISREISKRFEEVIRGNISDVLSQLTDPKGEFVIVVSGNQEIKTYENVTVIEHVNAYIKEGKSVSEAIGMVAKERSVPKKEIYNEYHGIKK